MGEWVSEGGDDISDPLSPRTGVLRNTDCGTLLRFASDCRGGQISASSADDPLLIGGAITSSSPATGVVGRLVMREGDERGDSTDECISSSATGSLPTRGGDRVRLS